MRFRSSKELAEQKHRKAPPNYFSRRVQYKLFALVALLMGVVLAIEKVADPGMFSFFGSSDPVTDQKLINTTGETTPGSLNIRHWLTMACFKPANHLKPILMFVKPTSICESDFQTPHIQPKKTGGRHHS